MVKTEYSKHVQTLVGMNHCVGIARRDAAYHCLMAFTSSASNVLDNEDVAKRLHGYEHCSWLLTEAMNATKQATISTDRQGLIDRPAVHILKLLEAFVSTVVSLANHVTIMGETSQVLLEPLGEDMHKLLIESCRDFSSTENEARKSLLHILEIGRLLLESSSANHKQAFTADESRRYNVAYDEYVRLYSNENFENSMRLR